MNIDKEFDNFIEFPGEDKMHVTSVSAKLFAKHCVSKLESAIRETIEENPHLAGIRCNALLCDFNSIWVKL